MDVEIQDRLDAMRAHELTGKKVRLEYIMDTIKLIDERRVRLNTEGKFDRDHLDNEGDRLVALRIPCVYSDPTCGRKLCSNCAQDGQWS